VVGRSGWPGLWIALLASGGGANDGSGERFIDDSVRDNDSP